MDFHRGDHLALHQSLPARDGGQRDHRIDRVQRTTLLGLHFGQPGYSGMDVHPTGAHHAQP